MLTEKKIQKILDELAGNLQLEIDIVDLNAIVVASSSQPRIGYLEPSLIERLKVPYKNIFSHNGRTFARIVADKRIGYYTAVEGSNKTAANYSVLISRLIEANLNVVLRKLTREEVLRKVLVGHLIGVELQECVRDNKLEAEMPICVFVIRTVQMEAEKAYRVLLEAFPKNSSDIPVLVDACTIALIKAVSGDVEHVELSQLADAIAETVLNEASIKAFIGMGGRKPSIFEANASYLEAVKAIVVGRVSNPTDNVYIYDNLLLERFLHDVPSSACHGFYRHIFNDEFNKLFNNEMISTVEKLFDNSLNLSEASRQLYIHRNTLVYRIDKIQRASGLDLRNFHDAITFKIMMMLKKREQECSD